MKPTISLIGAGRVGCAVSKRLQVAGYPISAVISRNHGRAVAACNFIGCSTTLASIQSIDATTAQIILLAVPDDHISLVAQQLQAQTKLTEQTTIIHFSGLHPANIMRHSTSSATLLSLHPLLPFASRQIAFDKLTQCPCALESSDELALALGAQLVDAIGGQSFTIASDKKVLYHAAACIASNYLVTLLATAQELLIKCGIEPDQAIPLLLPLVQASVENVQQIGTEQGLTGPIVRGDVGTVAKHIEALQDNMPELLQPYLQLGNQTAVLAGKSDRLPPAKVIALHNLLRQKQQT
ncbi:MAG: DUF2520 domain-containing protein [Thermodesulfobacteriota bacterium]|nr:DUF2520 domain-containing protein [Thermodesulfobacteriota bacterium]